MLKVLMDFQVFFFITLSESTRIVKYCNNYVFDIDYPSKVPLNVFTISKDILSSTDHNRYFRAKAWEFITISDFHQTNDCSLNSIINYTFKLFKLGIKVNLLRVKGPLNQVENN